MTVTAEYAAKDCHRSTAHRYCTGRHSVSAELGRRSTSRNAGHALKRHAERCHPPGSRGQFFSRRPPAGWYRAAGQQQVHLLRVEPGSPISVTYATSTSTREWVDGTARSRRRVASIATLLISPQRWPTALRLLPTCSAPSDCRFPQGESHLCAIAALLGLVTVSIMLATARRSRCHMSRKFSRLSSSTRLHDLR